MDPILNQLRSVAFNALAAALMLCVSGLPFGSNGATPNAPDSDTPAMVPGWKIQLIAQSPAINHPSVVTTAPDGRIFVAEDPMDITAEAHAPLGRILCLFPDGHRTVFATNLHAVFGMQFLEGKLYVLHNPRFTVFRDVNGRGTEPDDLIPSTLPNPWALDWNDHVPANFKLGMDGYFYIAVGDKGLFGATGKDGRKVNLHGGGIVRIRPDGTGLEIFSTGVRNILDVGLNEEDEIFSYDNTDEQQWMGRVTHMVDGGFYGYPFDFIPQRPYTLWMFADYGGGAATGVLSYDDDALPVEYHGNLFLADFGKRQVMRVRLSRQGSTYRALEKIDLFPNPPPDFRPVGIAWTPDARGFYLCDWQHRDVKGTNAVGRLWKATYQGESRSAPRPAWWADAAMGRDVTAPNVELLEALAHPSRSVRLTTQRRLSDRGGAVAPMLIQYLETQSLPSWGRTHALWALDAIDEGRSAQRSILQLLKDSSPTLRAQALRQLGTRQNNAALEAIHATLQDEHPWVRFHAATALGRIGSPNSIPLLMTSLRETDLFARYAAFHALQRIGLAHPDSWPTLAAGLTHREPRIVQGTSFALRDVYHPLLTATLSQLAQDSTLPESNRLAALQLLTSTHSKAPEWNGEWWAYHPANSKPPSKSIPWEGTPITSSTLQSLIATNHPTSLRLTALDGIAEFRDLSALSGLHSIIHSESDPKLQSTMVDTLASLKDPRSTDVITSLISNPNTQPAVFPSLIQAAQSLAGDSTKRALLDFLKSRARAMGHVAITLTTLGGWPESNVADAIEPFLKDSDPAIRHAALGAWARISRSGAGPKLIASLEDSSIEVRRLAITRLGQLKIPESIPHLIKLATSNEVRTEVLSALAQMPSLNALDLHVQALTESNPTAREDHRKAIASIGEEALPNLEAKASGFAPGTLQELQRIYATNALARRGPLFKELKSTRSQDDYDRFAANQGGSVEKGRALFRNTQGVACIKCHKVGGEGGQVGPDLSQAGSQFGKATLIESVLYPSKAIREGYQQWMIETVDGEVFSGILRSESPDEIVLQDTEGRLHKIPPRNITERSKSNLSLMPEGLESSLSLQEFADLIAYLQSLR